MFIKKTPSFLFIVLVLFSCKDGALSPLTQSVERIDETLGGQGGTVSSPEEFVNGNCDEINLLTPLGFDDPYAGCMWNIINRGQTIRKLPGNSYFEKHGTPGADLNMTGYALGNYSGKGVKVHVADDSFAPTHPDFKSNFDLKNSKDCRGFGKLPYDPKPQSNHGIQVSGIIGAVGKNGKGTVGVAHKASVSGYNVFACRNFIFAADTPNIDIWNGSYGTPTCSAHHQQDQIIHEAFEAGAVKNGVLYIKSAGNGRVPNTNPLAQCQKGYGDANRDPTNTHPYVTPVAALDNQGKIASYSSPGASIFIAAPAGHTEKAGFPGICTITRDPITFELGYSCSLFGTSAAAPNISGAAALIKEANPQLNNLDILHILAKTSQPIDENIITGSHLGKTLHIVGKNYVNYSVNSHGYQHSFNTGFGLPNIDDAVKMAESYSESLGKLERYSESFNVPVPESDSDRLKVPAKSCVSKSITIDKDFQVFLNRFSLSITGPIKDLVITFTMPDGAVAQLARDSEIAGNSYAHNQKFKAYAGFGTNARGTWEVEVCNNSFEKEASYKNTRMEIWGFERINSIEEK